MNKINYLILLIITILLACYKNESLDSKNNCKNEKELVTIVDSTLERHKQALKIINNYPLNEWSKNILTRIEAVVGTEVTLDLQEQIKNTLKEKDILEMRLSLLTEVYDANELAMLADLYAKKESKTLLNKISVHDDKLRELIMPALSKVLGSAPETQN